MDQVVVFLQQVEGVPVKAGNYMGLTGSRHASRHVLELSLISPTAPTVKPELRSSWAGIKERTPSSKLYYKVVVHLGRTLHGLEVCAAAAQALQAAFFLGTWVCDRDQAFADADCLRKSSGFCNRGCYLQWHCQSAQCSQLEPRFSQVYANIVAERMRNLWPSSALLPFLATATAFSLGFAD